MKSNIAKHGTRRCGAVQLLSLFMACIMVLLVMPVIPLTASAEEVSDLPQVDYTPFLIESVNGQAVYNAQTAEMAFCFEVEAENYVNNHADTDISTVPDQSFSFTYDNTTYFLDSVYISDPGKYFSVSAFLDSTCGFLAGMLNYVDCFGREKHVMLVCFSGTDGAMDTATDLSFVAERVDNDHWYHNGFYEVAKSHYNSIKDQPFSMGNGNNYTFSEYVGKMSEAGDDYQMIVTGHSLGAAVANIFTSYFIDTLGGASVQKNSFAYTFASPLTSSDGTASRTSICNVFNYINRYDWVPKVGYGAVKANVSVAQGGREGIDLTYTAGDASVANMLIVLGDGKKGLNFKNHKMNADVYGSILKQANLNICNHLSAFVLYNHYDASTNTYQRIVYNNGQLIVSGCGVLAGDWNYNTLIEWANVRNTCTSLVFEHGCSITQIGDNAFAGMTGLVNTLVLPSTVTAIGNYAFFRCGFTGSLNIPASMKTVGISAFNGCSNLSSIDALSAKDMTWEYGAFANCVSSKDAISLPGIDVNKRFDDYFAVYYVQDINGRVYEITPQDKTAGNKVLPGDKIYMARLMDKIIADRPYYDFHYRLTTGNLEDYDNILNSSTSLFRKTLINVSLAKIFKK